MPEAKEISFDKQVYYKLIALWVLCEGFLGGIIHGLKIPVSGLVVGSGAIICICLIAYYVPVKGAIIKATIIVAIFKMMLSPHSPPTAYIAVFFQGLLGQLLFMNLKFYRASCIVLGLFAMVESAVQRILVLVILYGTEFWAAIDQYISRLTNQATVTNYTSSLAVGYIFLHAVVGIFIGWFAGHLAIRSEKWTSTHEYLIEEVQEPNDGKKSELPSKRKKIMKLSLFVIWVLLIISFLQSVSEIGNPILPANVAVQVLFRSILVVLTWYFFISPLVMLLMKKGLEKQKENKQTDIQQVMLLLPSTKYIVSKSWQMSTGYNHLRRIKNCIKIILVNTLFIRNGR
ncbi:MAG TPA: hypothetical protein VF622_03360 [Segetibacter sp.]|jgi:hypothetical protein